MISHTTQRYKVIAASGRRFAPTTPYDEYIIEAKSEREAVTKMKRMTGGRPLKSIELFEGVTP